MRFEFATASRILCGAGTLQEAAPIAAQFGSRALIVTGREARRAAGLSEALHAARVTTSMFTVAGEPTTQLIEQGLVQAREFGCNVVIGIGGGSVLDAGKAIAALLTNEGTLLDYLEVIGAARTLTEPAAPYIAIPTTAGTGAEVTRNAVLGSPEHGLKVSLRSPLMLPRVAVIDPALTHSLPASLTAATGLDALTQLIEPYVSTRANPLTDMLCRDGMARVARALGPAYYDGENGEARADMALASLYGGLALANAGLGAVHGLAGPIGGMFTAPHGALCGRLLPFVMDMNLTALRERQPASPALPRYRDIARILTGEPGAAAEDGVAWVYQLCADLQIPALGTYGITSADIPLIVPRTQAASSMQANPLPLTDAELARVLTEAL